MIISGILAAKSRSRRHSFQIYSSLFLQNGFVFAMRAITSSADKIEG
jgi:hypothetical protein